MRHQPLFMFNNATEIATTHLTWKSTLFRVILILVWTGTVFAMGMGWQRSPLCEMKSYRDLVTGYLVTVCVIEVMK